MFLFDFPFPFQNKAIAHMAHARTCFVLSNFIRALLMKRLSAGYCVKHLFRIFPGFSANERASLKRKPYIAVCSTDLARPLINAIISRHCAHDVCNRNR